jgi:type IV pilus assembly protein PilA
MLARLRKTHEENEGGFTLIELLVVVIIIGILAAIAIPTFLNQREKAWKKAAVSDLRNAATKMEEHFDDAGTYGANTTVTPNLVPNTGAYAFKPSENVTLAIVQAGTGGYCLTANHAQLTATGVDYVFHSGTGRPVEGTACPAATATIPAYTP